MPSKQLVRLLTIAAAIVATAVVALVPTADSLTVAGQYAVATMVFAAVLWISGALPLPLTALCIPILLTVFGVYPDFGDAVAGFADPVIFLLLAGFMLAEAFQTHDIDRRFAYLILVRFGTSARGLVLGVMVATALLSMLISNTATVAMMVPIVLGIVASVTALTKTDEDNPSANASNLQIGMLLGVAYAASLGGVGTLIGTPPNAIVVGQIGELVGYEITFVEWLAIGLPMVVVTLPVAWVLLTYVVYPPRSST
nr:MULTISPECIES: SLC13 family permease [Haloferax]